MPESPGGLDLATLGLELDAREFVARGEQSIKALERLGKAGDEAERTTKSLSGAMRDAADSASQQVTAAQRLSQAQEEFAAARREREEAEAAQREQRGDQEVQVARRTAEEVAAERERINAEQEAKWRARQEQRAAEDRARAERSGAEEARARAEALQRQFAADVARIREGQARGFLSPAEAREAGREAAREYNQGMVETIDQGFRAGAFSGGEGRELRTQLAGSLKNVDEAGKSAAVGVGRLNRSLVSLLRQATGANPAVAQLANVVGSFALGTGMLAAVLGGIAAVGLAYRHLTADAREMKEATEEANAELERIAERRRVDRLGPVGVIGEAAEVAEKRVARLRAQIERLEASARVDPAGATALARDPDAERIQRQRLASLREALDEQLALLGEGRGEQADLEEQAMQDAARRDAERLAQLISANQATEAERLRATQVLAVQQAELDRLSSEGASEENQDARLRAIQIIQSITGALEQRADATARAAEASRARVADMRLEAEQQERLLEAARHSTAAYDATAAAIERENAIRQAGTSVREQERQQAEELAAVAFDRARAIEEEVAARERAAADQSRAQEAASVAELRELTESYTGTVEGLKEAQAELIREQEIAREVEEALAEGTNKSREELEAMIRARRENREAIESETAAREAAAEFEAGVQDLSREVRERRELLRIHEEHEGSQEELNEAVREYNRELRVQAAMRELLARNPTLTDEEIERYRELVAELAAVNDEIDALGGKGASGANEFESEWVSAVSVVGASLGGLASQVANIVTAFAQGGPTAGLLAMGGVALNALTGDRGQAERERQEAMERSVSELERFSAALRDSITELEKTRTDAVDKLVEGLQAALPDNIQLDLSRSQDALESWTQVIGRGEASVEDLMDWFSGMARDAAVAEFRAGDLNRGAVPGRARELMEEWQPVIDAWMDAARAVEERRQADIGRIEDRLRIRQLDASGDTEGAEELRRQKELEKELAEARALESNALVVMIEETWAMEKAARAAADATAALRSARDEELSLQHREAMLRGDERGALHARLQRQAEAELNALQDRLDAGKISEEHFLRVADIIRGEVNQALAEMAQAAREAAEAERFRQAMDTENLRVRLLRMQGLHVEAAQLQANIDLQNALNEGRNGEYLAILQQINALQIQEAAQRNVTSATQEMNRTLQDTTRMLNAPSGISNALIRHRAFQGLEGAGPAPVNRVQQSTQTQTVHMTFGDLSFPNVTEPTDVKRMLRELLTEGQKQARAGSGNVFISGMD